MCLFQEQQGSRLSSGEKGKDGRNEIKEVMRGHIMKSLKDKDFGFYSKYDGEPLEDFEQGTDLNLDVVCMKKGRIRHAS